MKFTPTAVLAALLLAGAAQAQLKMPGQAGSPDASAAPPMGNAQSSPQPRPNVVPPNMPDPYTKEFHACAQKSQELTRTKPQGDPEVIRSWRSCFEAETVRQEAKIASSVQRLAQFITPGEKKRLEVSNADWHRFRNSDCAFAADPKGTPENVAMNAQCVFDRTTERAHDLEGFTQLVIQRDAQKKAAAAAPAPAAPAADAGKQ
jgi:uncharacterized protein YecT (DUF1311 family)